MADAAEAPPVVMVAGGAASRVATKLGEAGLAARAVAAEEILDAVRRERPAALVVERGGPRAAGLALCRAVREDPHLGSVAIVVLEAREDLPDLLSALDAGADDVVSPTAPVAEIVARVATAVRLRRVRQAREGGSYREALAELASAVGNEINSPLTALLGHLELARQWAQAGEVERVLHNLREAGETARRIGRVAQRLASSAESAARDGAS